MTKCAEHQKEIHDCLTLGIVDGEREILQQEINMLRMEPCQLPKCVQREAKMRKLVQAVLTWQERAYDYREEEMEHAVNKALMEALSDPSGEK